MTSDEHGSIVTPHDALAERIAVAPAVRSMSRPVAP
jgi:hypothetical protein